MNCEIIDPTLFPGWDEMVASCPGHTFFHSSNWARVLCDFYSYKPLYFTVRDDGTISALVPLMEVDSVLTGKRGVSIPFTDLCEPIASKRNGFSPVFNEILQYGKKAGWKHVEIRGGTNLFSRPVGTPGNHEKSGGTLGNPGRRSHRLNGASPYRTYARHVLALHEAEAVTLKQLSPATRRNVRKAADSGVRVSLSNAEKDLDTYYRLHCLTRKRQGVPPQPRGFFRAIHRNVISKGKGFTTLASFQGAPISGAVFFHSGKNAIYKFGASDLNYQELRPANLVMWEAIRHFSQNGFEELCFGRTDLEHAGLIRFKAGWGAREERLNYYRYDLNKSAFVEGAPEMNGLSGRVFSRLPIPILRLVGEMLYRHMG